MSIKLKKDIDRKDADFTKTYQDSLNVDPVERIKYYRRVKDILTKAFLELLELKEELIANVSTSPDKPENFRILVCATSLTSVFRALPEKERVKISGCKDSLSGEEITPIDRCKKLSSESDQIKYLLSTAKEMLKILETLVEPSILKTVSIMIALKLQEKDWQGPVGKTSAALIALGVILSIIQIIIPNFSEYSQEYWYKHPLGWGVFSLIIAAVGLLANQSQRISNTIKWAIIFISGAFVLGIIMPKIGILFW